MHLRLAVPPHAAMCLERQRDLVGPFDGASGPAGRVELVREPRHVLLALGVEIPGDPREAAVDAGFVHERFDPVDGVAA